MTFFMDRTFFFENGEVARRDEMSRFAQDSDPATPSTDEGGIEGAMPR
jgi:hypothetical protein